MKLFISAGEPSGDLHGANLAKSLLARQPDLQLTGFGGDRMASAGVDLLYPLTNLAVMWFGRVLANLDKFFHLGAKAESYFRRERPDAVILIDYPGFHWHVAQRAQRYGIPVYYFVPPQLWAWRGGRVKMVRKYFRAVLTALPFEEEWYRSRGVRTQYVGHPYFDEIANQRLDESYVAEQRQRGGRIIALLPGSRTQEVLANFPTMVQAAEKLAGQFPDLRFLVAAYKPKQAQLCQEILGSSRAPVEIHLHRTPEIIALADACVAVSGSVGLELMVRRLPSIVLYKVGWLFRKVAEQLKTCQYISLVNLLANEEVYPELAGSKDYTPDLVRILGDWMHDPASFARVRQKLESLNQQVAVPGAVDRAAEFLLQDLR